MADLFAASTTEPTENDPKPGDNQSTENRGEASQPEVLKKQSSNKLPDEKPSQAEGDRETVEEDLEEKNLDE